MTRRRTAGLTAIAAVAMMTSAPGLRAQDTTVSVHGKVVNPAGQPVTSGEVDLTKDKGAITNDTKYDNKFPVGADGTFKGTGVAPGDYYAYFLQSGKPVDRMDFKVEKGETGDQTLDFDMTREAYLKGMTPEERKALEEYKTKNAAAVAANSQVKNLNGMLTSVRADLKSSTPNYDKDIADMQSATTAMPTEPVLWMELGDAQAAKANKGAADDKAAKKPVQTDDAVTSGYGAAADSYKKGLDLASTGKQPNPTQQAQAEGLLGDVYAKSGKGTEATEAYDKAAQLNPAGAGMYYSNEAVTLYNAGQGDAAATAADKAIAADPNKPVPYYIKGQSLIGKASFDNKTQKIVPAPGTVEAYQKYLELAPDGPFAPSVKEVLAGLGEKIDTRYRAGKK